MSEDEYDDRSSDDELQKNLKSPANEALERLRAREKPTDEDAKLAEPFYQKLADQERVPFLFVRGSFFLGREMSQRADLIGYDYLRRICQISERTQRLDRYISAAELDSEGAVGSGGMLYSPDPQDSSERYDDDDGYDWETTNQQSGFEEVITPKDRRLYLEEIKERKAKGATVENDPLLVQLMELLGETTHQGNIKNANPEPEKIRQKVWQAVEYTYEDMEGQDTGTQELRLIAADFRTHIKRGKDYIYTGPIIFRFF